MNRKYLIYYISRIRKKAARFIDNNLKHENLDHLCSSHGTILSALYAEDKALTMKDISKRIGRNKSTTTQLVDKLVLGGYVEKVRCKSDRRVSEVRLTAKGRGIQPSFQSISGRLVEKAYEGFSEAETEELLRLLKKLSDNFRD